MEAVARDNRYALFQGPRRAVSMGPRQPCGEKGTDHRCNLLSYLISHNGTPETERDEVHPLYMYLQI